MTTINATSLTAITQAEEPPPLRTVRKPEPLPVPPAQPTISVDNAARSPAARFAGQLSLGSGLSKTETPQQTSTDDRTAAGERAATRDRAGPSEKSPATSEGNGIGRPDGDTDDGASAFSAEGDGADRTPPPKLTFDAAGLYSLGIFA